MKVAKEFKAMNAPISKALTVKLGGRELRIASYETAHMLNGKIIGFTQLQKTSALNDDRVTINEHLAYKVILEKAPSFAIDYCICVDDINNVWVAVVS